MLRNILVAFALSVLSTIALAANPVFNCTGLGTAPNTCHALTDNFPATGIQPSQCKLYSGGVPVVSVAASGAAGALNCNIAMPPGSFPNGTYTITIAAIASDGNEGAQGAPFVFQSSAGAPPAPTNLRVTSP